jgi:membrane fusion protein, heavy metal efflux system
MSQRARSVINGVGVTLGLITATLLVLSSIGWPVTGGVFRTATHAAAAADPAAVAGSGEHEGAVAGDSCCPPAAAAPGSTAGALTQARLALAEPRDAGRQWCGEHQVYEDSCALCSPDSAKALAPGEGMLIRLATGDAVQKAGIRSARAHSPMEGGSKGFVCRATYNENALVHIVPMVSGIVTGVHTDLGARVDAGDPLVTLASPELAAAQGAYLEALAEETLAAEAFARETRLREKEISAARELQVAQAALDTARVRVQTAEQHLRVLGWTSEAVKTLQRQRTQGSALVLRAPFAGTVVERHAVLGEAVERGAALFTVADLDQMWLELAVPPRMAGAVGAGASVQARFPDLAGLVLEGRIEWVASYIDADSRTIHMRAVVPNPGGVVKHNMFGQATVAGMAAEGTLHVPEDAVQYHDGRPLVFVRRADDLVEVRAVALGGRSNGYMEIREGLAPDEDLVVARAHALKSEMLKARLGAGCTDH